MAIAWAVFGGAAVNGSTRRGLNRAHGGLALSLLGGLTMRTRPAQMRVRLAGNRCAVARFAKVLVACMSFCGRIDPDGDDHAIISADEPRHAIRLPRQQLRGGGMVGRNADHRGRIGIRLPVYADEPQAGGIERQLNPACLPRQIRQRPPNGLRERGSSRRWRG